MPGLSRLVILALSAVLLLLAADAAAARDAEVIEGGYIIRCEGSVLDPSAATTRRERRDGFDSSLGARSVHVAIIVTGVDLVHPDLAVAGGRNCVNTAAAPDDDNGAAGSIAARNSGAGVVGVAPGTRIFAAKVLNSAGGGTASQVIRGIDWVTSTRFDSDPSNDIAVANMSLGGGGRGC